MRYRPAATVLGAPQATYRAWLQRKRVQALLRARLHPHDADAYLALVADLDAELAA
jgi:hypothetical protein